MERRTCPGRVSEHGRVHVLALGDYPGSLYVAHRDKANDDNRGVKLAAQKGIPGAKVFHHKTPVDGIKFLKEYGNKGNDHITKKTILECYREALTIDVAWERRKKEMNWSIASLTYAVHETKKWEFACGVLPRRWERPRHYEVCLKPLVVCILATFVRSVIQSPFLLSTYVIVFVFWGVGR